MTTHIHFFEIWGNGFLICMLFLTALWIVSIFIKNVSIIDVFWGTGFVILAFYYLYAAGNYSPRAILLVALVAIWGLRLSVYLLWRNWGKGEDYRYQKFRQDYGPRRYWWFSFFQVFLLQGVLMSLIAMTLLGTFVYSSASELLPLDYAALTIWLIGFAFEAGGDYQLAAFKKDKSNKGKVLQTGFWKYTRHPNYFGDATVWWAFALFAILSGCYPVILGSLIMNILLLKVSGVSLLERNLTTSKPEYADYIKRTNAFFPWFPKGR